MHEHNPRLQWILELSRPGFGAAPDQIRMGCVGEVGCPLWGEPAGGARQMALGCSHAPKNTTPEERAAIRPWHGCLDYLFVCARERGTEGGVVEECDGMRVCVC